MVIMTTDNDYMVMMTMMMTRMTRDPTPLILSPPKHWNTLSQKWKPHLPLFLPPQLQPGRLPPGPPLLTEPPPVWVVLLLLLSFGHKTKILIMSQIKDFNENILYVLKVPKSLKVLQSY